LGFQRFSEQPERGLVKMAVLTNSIDEILRELNKGNTTVVLTDEDLRNAELDINQKMEIFSTEQRSYFNRSVESASRAYLTF
jgi:hypothetical protein